MPRPGLCRVLSQKALSTGFCLWARGIVLEGRSSTKLPAAHSAPYRTSIPITKLEHC